MQGESEQTLSPDNPLFGKVQDGYLTGQMLLAMPMMEDTRFERAVVYVCAHNDQGAMGLIINQDFDGVEFSSLLDQLNIKSDAPFTDLPVHCGGPVEAARGFVLHSDDFAREGTMPVNNEICLTGTMDILQAIAHGEGPRKHFFALGYAGWSPGQLEEELRANAWLTMPCNEKLIFELDIEKRWDAGLKTLGIDPIMLSADAGRA